MNEQKNDEKKRTITIVLPEGPAQNIPYENLKGLAWEIANAIQTNTTGAPRNEVDAAIGEVRKAILACRPVIKLGDMVRLQVRALGSDSYERALLESMAGKKFEVIGLLPFKCDSKTFESLEIDKGARAVLRLGQSTTLTVPTKWLVLADEEQSA